MEKTSALIKDQLPAPGSDQTVPAALYERAYNAWQSAASRSSINASQWDLAAVERDELARLLRLVLMKFDVRPAHLPYAEPFPSNRNSLMDIAEAVIRGDQRGLPEPYAYPGIPFDSKPLPPKHFEARYLEYVKLRRLTDRANPDEIARYGGLNKLFEDF